MSKKRDRRGRDPPVVVKVSVSDGQVKVTLPKKTALRLNLIGEEGEPGNVTHLLVTTYRNRVTLHPVEMTDVEAEE